MTFSQRICSFGFSRSACLRGRSNLPAFPGARRAAARQRKAEFAKWGVALAPEKPSRRAFARERSWQGPVDERTSTSAGTSAAVRRQTLPSTGTAAPGASSRRARAADGIGDSYSMPLALQNCSRGLRARRSISQLMTLAIFRPTPYMA